MVPGAGGPGEGSGARPFVLDDWSGTGQIAGVDHVGVATKVAGDTIFTVGKSTGRGVKRGERDTSSVVGCDCLERVQSHRDET
ncbi:hypothetical protein ABZ297_12425 [Nonomuraea sp. NPDC005983]|uniref:hypothetical protein n=1 Tax=Nonomuraea sp. NPDC005983 TaxID=3155595 RepID=UPI00339E230D